jgi:Tol biopolymer transport system component
MIEEGHMAGISGSPDVTVTRVGTEGEALGPDAASGRTRWLSVGMAAWVVVAFYFLLWSVLQNLSPDPALSVYIIPLYLALAVLALASISLIVSARRKGGTWRDAFSPGYGVIGAGLVTVLAGFVTDVGWREGVGQPEGIAGLLAPTRLLFIIGLGLIALAPLRAALRSHGESVAIWPAIARWPAVLSASLLLAVLWLPGGFAPAASPWLERAPVTTNAEIWLMDADGSNQTRLIEAHDGAMAWNAAWSPDGKRLTYTHLVQGDHPPVYVPDEADIWIANADGSDAHPLVELPGWQWIPHWSPDGAWIVYTDEPEAGPWAEPGPAGLGGGGILGTGFGFGSSSPVRTYADIWRVRADGTGSPERITSDPGDDRAATYSPDGTKLAFDSTRAEGTDIWVMGADGSDPRQLTFDHGFTWGAAWAPDGSSIVFNSWRSDNQDLYLIDPDGGNSTRLTSSPEQELEPSWSADGTRIIFRRLDGPIDGGEILSIDADGNDERLLSREPGAADELTSGGGAWAPDGRIAFMRAANPPADAHPLVREDLATAGMLLSVMLLAFVAVLLARVDPPIGAFTVLIGVPTALLGAAADRSQFIPAAIVGGLAVDILVRFAPERWKVVVAGAASAAAFVVGAELTVFFTGGLDWSGSLLAGVVVAAAAVGAGLAEVVGRPLKAESNP